MPQEDEILTESDSDCLIPSTEVIDPQDTSECFKTRHVLALMGFFGFANVYAMRVNLSVAIVAMVNSSAIPHVDNDTVDACPGAPVNSTTPTHDGEFAWDEATQGMVLGSFFYGYVLTQIPGGRFAELCGGKRVFGLGVLLTALFTIASPLAARLGKGLFVAIRVLEGLGEGVTFPAMHVMLSRWVPQQDQSKYAAYVYAGAHFGTIISMPLSGWLCSVDGVPGGGWPLAFYLTGGLGVLWFVVWMLLIADTPQLHPRISDAEREYIVHSLGHRSDTKNPPPVPWFAMLTSPPVLAILVTQCGQSWAFYTVLTELPSYMANILHFDIKKNSMLSTLPYISTWGSGILFSMLADSLVARGKLRRKNSYKIFNSIASIMPGVCLVGIAWAGCGWRITLALLAASGFFSGSSYAGYQMNHIALSPTFAGTMYGFTNAAGNTAGFLAPYATGLLIKNQETLERWSLVFYISAAITFTTSLFYIAFASDEVQPWGVAKVPGQMPSADSSINSPESGPSEGADNYDGPTFVKA